MLDGFRWFSNTYGFLDQKLARGELTFRIRLPTFGACLVTGDPALLAEIERNKDLIGGRGTTALRPVVGNTSLIVLEGAQHAEHRRIFAPPFFRADGEEAAAPTLRWARQVTGELRAGDVVSGMDIVSRITLNVIVETMFGALSATRHREIVQLLSVWMQSFSQPLVLFMRALHIDWGPRSPWGRFRRNRQAVERFIRDELALRADDPGAGVLGHALTAIKSGASLSEDDLVSEVITFLLFGHDTSAAAMGWVLYYLAQNPIPQQRISEEWLAQGHDSSARELPYILASVRESMRLAPVVVHLTRHALRATRVGAHAIAEGERVLPCAYLAHRNPAVFDEPARFKPERFLGTRHYGHAYFPFGAGSRLCAGMPYALRQMACITGLLASRFRLELAAPGEVRPVRKMVLITPSGGPRLKLKTA